MADFIAIDAKADISASKKGKMTPAQHAQLNAWCLANKTGILDWGDCCESTASSYSVVNGAATVVFKKGYIVICGRLIQCEDGAEINVSAPASGTTIGSIILRFNLNGSGINECKVMTTTNSTLVQDDLNDNPISGVYEFKLYDYEATSTTVELTRADTNYIPNVGTFLTGTGMTGTGDPPLEGYNRTQGTIEERLTRLGFSGGDIALDPTSAVGDDFSSLITVQNQLGQQNQYAVTRQGNYVIGKFSVTYSIPSQSGAANEVYLGTIDAEFSPKTDTIIYTGLSQAPGAGSAYLATSMVSINTNGEITIYFPWNELYPSVQTSATMQVNFGYEVNPRT